MYYGSNMAPVIWVPVSVRRGLRGVCEIERGYSGCLINPAPLLFVDAGL